MARHDLLTSETSFKVVLPAWPCSMVSLGWSYICELDGRLDSHFQRPCAARWAAVWLRASRGLASSCGQNCVLQRHVCLGLGGVRQGDKACQLVLTCGGLEAALRRLCQMTWMSSCLVERGRPWNIQTVVGVRKLSSSLACEMVAWRSAKLHSLHATRRFDLTSSGELCGGGDTVLVSA
ncbi:hypothetical protein Micbo1qcDRAFT_167316 [Microdochium bolleyi]|uniref:Uncharacterized protein n=1 Tax=Microdochium bolleyi TaxID=196109 RepID=A0A136IS21_9PEZI|nr:hypothetical protein Micbo1qcDRAFT_167316 [Microdochium bolleyi]